MLSIDASAALRKPIDARTDEDHLFLRRESTRESKDPNSGGRSLNNGVGWIQIVRPGQSIDEIPQSIGLPKPHQDLATARGIAIGSALGLGVWALLGTLVAIVVL